MLDAWEFNATIDRAFGAATSRLFAPSVGGRFAGTLPPSTNDLSTRIFTLDSTELLLILEFQLPAIDPGGW
jgi:hypothetical protein